MTELLIDFESWDNVGNRCGKDCSHELCGSGEPAYICGLSGNFADLIAEKLWGMNSQSN